MLEITLHKTVKIHSLDAKLSHLTFGYKKSTEVSFLCFVFLNLPFTEIFFHQMLEDVRWKKKLNTLLFF